MPWRRFSRLASLRILQVHNFYQQPGGEDQVYAAEYELLTRHGHQVERYAVHNDAIEGMAGLAAGMRTIWNSRTREEAGALLRRFRPDVLHCHNTFPLISPSIYYAAAAEGAPVVQTLHNYRLVCPAATLYRDGHVCEDCVGRMVPYPAVIHGCYRGNRKASAAVAAMLTAHRAAGTWGRRIARYIALTEFAKGKLIEGGLPGEKIAVKPNFVAERITPGDGQGGFALYVGRLAEEKGIRTLMGAWERLPDVPLRVIGGGPLRSVVESACARLPQVEYLGFRPRGEALEAMRAAWCVVIPSEWYEGSPMTALEAMACGTPLLISDLGALAELGEGTLRFAPGDAAGLAAAVRKLRNNQGEAAELRRRARANYDANYTPERNYEQLLAIYREAIAAR